MWPTPLLVSSRNRPDDHGMNVCLINCGIERQHRCKDTSAHGHHSDLSKSGSLPADSPRSRKRSVGRVIGGGSSPSRGAVACGAQIPIWRVYSIDKSPARRSCWNDGGRGAQVLRLLVLVIAAIFRPKALLIAENLLSAAAVGCAAAAASAASLERRRSALLDPGKPMVQRLAASVADCETGNSSGLAASGLEGVLEMAIVS
jgi:hypothetical protein